MRYASFSPEKDFRVDDQKIREWVTRQVQPNAEKDEINALRAAFRLSVISLLRSQLSRLVSEETMTGAFLGAAAASVGICAEAYSGEGSPACSWIQYSKSGGHENSESVNGADFALLIRMRDGRARLAIFQAKRKMTESNKINLSRAKKGSETSSGKEQLLRLVDYGTSVYGDTFNSDTEVDQLHWIHYLLYQKEELNCCSIDQLKEIHVAFKADSDGGKLDKKTSNILDENGEKDKSDNGVVDLSKKKLVSLVSLLDIGATEPDPVKEGKNSSIADRNTPGWLEIQDERQLTLIISRLANKVDLYFAEENGAQDYEPIPTNAISKEHRYTIKEIVGMLFNQDGNFNPPSFGRTEREALKREKDNKNSRNQAPVDNSLESGKVGRHSKSVGQAVQSTSSFYKKKNRKM
ncbi:hypothetical protein [Stenotrophomonas forensis]|uniref:hypothetical protein n=1 Tax=Stenotrophomonas forensis TaxID=2871169 RepID=UPI0039C63114